VRLFVAESYAEMSTLGAEVVVEELLRRPEAVISLTTGFTPAGLFRVLPQLCASRGIGLARARYISSEEYVGVSADSPISLFGWLWRDLLAPNHVPAAQVLRLDGAATSPAEECWRFDGAIEQWGGIDLVLQTIGANGHFGFNEPGSAASASSRSVEMEPSTREANGRYWPAGTAVPTHGLTMGVRQTLNARHILLLASGSAKARALYDAMTAPIGEGMPCSMLRLATRLTVIADGAAGSLLAD
jgi:glucosamine-6-phosphate deaminase